VLEAQWHGSAVLGGYVTDYAMRCNGTHSSNPPIPLTGSNFSS
jgi:hypothetical protein